MSIGDPDTQVEFMLKELQHRYKSVLQVLKTATSVQEASDIFLVKFEAPTNTGSEVKKTRASYGEQYLKIYKDIEKEETNMSSPIAVLVSNCSFFETKVTPRSLSSWYISAKSRRFLEIRSIFQTRRCVYVPVRS